jgi:hypothetical protein
MALPGYRDWTIAARSMECKQDMNVCDVPKFWHVKEKSGLVTRTGRDGILD